MPGVALGAIILSLLGVLLNISGIQALLRQRIDLDVELRADGVANMVVAPIGGSSATTDSVTQRSLTGWACGVPGRRSPAAC